MSGTIESFDGVSRGFCNRTQSIVIQVEYSLAPESKYPVQEQQCKDVLDWIYDCNKHELFNMTFIQELGGVYLAGDSAGANMVANLTMKYSNLYHFKG